MTMKRTLAFLILALTASVTHAFAPSPINRPMGVAATSLQMAGFFDGIMKAFSNQEVISALTLNTEYYRMDTRSRDAMSCSRSRLPSISL